jgi:nicotinamidase/pyrazinamidase
MERPFVFVDIDTQRDFLEPGGALYINHSDAILPNLERLTAFAASNDIPVLATACCHTPNDPELEIFPSHCLRGSSGQQRIAQTDVAQTVILNLEDRFSGPLPRHLTVYKNELDLFSRADADDLVAAYGGAGPTFVVYGVATDYCVKAAVKGLLERHCRVAIVVDAIRAIDPAAEPPLLTDFANRGVLLTRTDVVCGG